jgi:hypothetical protein
MEIYRLKFISLDGEIEIFEEAFECDADHAARIYAAEHCQKPCQGRSVAPVAPYFPVVTQGVHDGSDKYGSSMRT